MLPVVAEAGEVLERVARARPPVVRRPTVDAVADRDLGVRIAVVLAVFGAGAHVKQLLDGRAAKGGGLQLRDDAVDGRGHVERAAAGQRARHEAGDGLGDRHEQMRRAGAEAIAVLLGDDRAPMEDEEAVGVGVVEQPAHGQLALLGREPDVAELALIPFEFPHRGVTAWDCGGRDKLADVLKCPPVIRGPLPVLQRDEPSRRKRRCSDHQPQLVTFWFHAGSHRNKIAAIRST